MLVRTQLGITYLLLHLHIRLKCSQICRGTLHIAVGLTVDWTESRQRFRSTGRGPRQGSSVGREGLDSGRRDADGRPRSPRGVRVSSLVVDLGTPHWNGWVPSNSFPTLARGGRTGTRLGPSHLLRRSSLGRPYTPTPCWSPAVPRGQEEGRTRRGVGARRTCLPPLLILSRE